jgi:hypothetical protein
LTLSPLPRTERYGTLSARRSTSGEDTLYGVDSLLTVLVEQNPFYASQYSLSVTTPVTTPVTLHYLTLTLSVGALYLHSKKTRNKDLRGSAQYAIPYTLYHNQQYPSCITTTHVHTSLVQKVNSYSLMPARGPASADVRMDGLWNRHGLKRINTPVRSS